MSKKPLRNNIKSDYEVSGMHCAACELTIEKKLARHPQVKKVTADLSKQKVFLELTEGSDPSKLKSELDSLIKPYGYSLFTTENAARVNWKQMLQGLAIAGIIVLIFLLVQRLGIVDLANTEQINLPFIFLIGIIASLSTCMAVVGGLVLSISGSYAKEGKFRPLLTFHLSRLISFFLLGGLIGILGSAFVLSSLTTFILNVILFLVMFILGTNMLGLYPKLSRFQLRLPKSFGKIAIQMEHSQSHLTPILLGALTFILPCGFTQSMQLYSLTTGSFLNGALTMLVFALGTLPVLGLISFASVKFSQTLQSGLFYKTAGFLILFFALFNFTAALTAVGLIAPILNL